MLLEYRQAGAVTASLGTLFQGSTTLWGKNQFFSLTIHFIAQFSAASEVGCLL